MNAALQTTYPELGAGGFTRFDGSVEFYGRINALVTPDATVLDLGAGRGRQFETANRYRRALAIMQGKVARVVGLDVDQAIMENPHLDEAKVYDGGVFPFPDRSFDLVYADWVLEHIRDPALFAGEIERVLRPDGWFCARTPNKLSFTAMAGRLVPDRLHARVLQRIQPGVRKAEDVFPAFYRLNSKRDVARFFPEDRWRNCTYLWNPEPAYHFGSPAMVRFMAAAQYIKAPIGGENLFVFVQKTAFSSE